LAFPALSSRLKKRRTPKENKFSDEAEKYIMQWLKGTDYKQSKE